MSNILINGLGRIGRQILKLLLLEHEYNLFVNDLNNDLDNLVYLLNYDSLYKEIGVNFIRKGNTIFCGGKTIHFSSFKTLEESLQSFAGVNLIIDSSGEKNKNYTELITKYKIDNIVVTHTDNSADFHMILGVNEKELDLNKHKVISSSICDSTVLGPVIKLISEKYGVIEGYVTTMHPFLNYQNLLDGNKISSDLTNSTKEDLFALGRQSINVVIPKNTTALDAVSKSYPQLDLNVYGVFSFRTPTTSVSSAVLTLKLNSKLDIKDLLSLFEEYSLNQEYNIIKINYEPLVSIDFLKSEYSAIIDNRWLEVINDNFIRVVIWYDNEYGYSSRVVDQVKLILRLIRGF